MPDKRESQFGFATASIYSSVDRKFRANNVKRRQFLSRDQRTVEAVLLGRLQQHRNWRRDEWHSQSPDMVSWCVFDRHMREKWQIRGEW